MLRVKKLDFLVALYIFCIVISELMGIKTFPLVQVSWLHLNASVAIFLLPIVFVINDIIVEVHGKERAQSIARSGIAMVAGVFLFTAFATALPPSVRFSSTESAYDTVFLSSLRIAGASLTAFLIAEMTDIFVFSRLRRKLKNKMLWARTNISNFAAQLADTVIFITLAFYSFSLPIGNNLKFLIGLIIPYWLLKCCMSVIETPFVYAGVKWLKKGDA